MGNNVKIKSYWEKGHKQAVFVDGIYQCKPAGNSRITCGDGDWLFLTGRDVHLVLEKSIVIMQVCEAETEGEFALWEVVRNE